jgi:translation initiation factor IF-3
LTYRVGRRIRVPEIRVIGPQGQQMGVMTVEQALLVAEADGFDLVEVSPKAFPPVCRIMDYGKFKYELAKKDRSARKHRSTVQVKEVKFRPKTDAHDMDFKMRHLRRFLAEGNKTRLVVTFRGREMAHPAIGHALLQRVAGELSDMAVIEQPAMADGKKLMLVLAPRGGVVRSAGPGPAPGAPAAAPAAAAPPGPRR